MSDRCTVVSATLDEPLAGTAAVAVAWLLIEDMGPWGADALRESTIDDAIAAGLERRSADAGVRVQMIRRHLRGRTSAATRTVFLVHSGPAPTWMARRELPEEELARLDPSLAKRAAPPPGWDAVDDDLLLVCTHAKRDACCAQYGRPLAEAVDRLATDRTWETSHTGGHRFAGVLIQLPDGHTFGRLRGGDAASLVSALASGRVPQRNYRGRSAVSSAAQAAEIAVRAATNLDGRDVVRTVSSVADGGGHVVTVDADGTPWRVVVASRPLGTLRAVSCGGHPEDRLRSEVVAAAPITASGVVRT